MIIPVKILDSDFLNISDPEEVEFLLNTDHVVLAAEAEDNKTLLIMGTNKAPHMVIDMDYQTYKALVSAGFESAATAAAIMKD